MLELDRIMVDIRPFVDTSEPWKKQRSDWRKKVGRKRFERS